MYVTFGGIHVSRIKHLSCSAPASSNSSKKTSFILTLDKDLPLILPVFLVYLNHQLALKVVPVYIFINPGYI